VLSRELWWLTAMKRATNLLIGLVLTESIDGPDGSWNPSKKGDLQNQTKHTGQGSADGEEGKPWKQKRNDESHEGNLCDKFLSL
jgi:hypothetical protein